MFAEGLNRAVDLENTYMHPSNHYSQHRKVKKILSQPIILAAIYFFFTKTQEKVNRVDAWDQYFVYLQPDKFRSNHFSPSKEQDALRVSLVHPSSSF